MGDEVLNCAGCLKNYLQGKVSGNLLSDFLSDEEFGAIIEAYKKISAIDRFCIRIF